MKTIKKSLPEKSLSKKSLSKKSLPLSKVYGLLEPGPVVLVSTVRNGKPNIMAMSWHTMLEFEPPLVGCVISDRNYSFKTLQSTKECVINIPTIALARQLVKCGNSSGRKVDKFTACNFTPAKAARVKAPLIGECYANLECRVIDTRLVSRYCFFILEVIKAWIDPKLKNPKTLHHRGNGNFFTPGRTFKLASQAK